MTKRKTSDVLRAARELISDPKRWAKGSMAKNERGFRVGILSKYATCWCAEGAVCFAERRLRVIGSSAYDALCNACPGEAPHEYNDNHTHKEVLALFDRAIEEREAAGD